jgi:hypothetical protein
MKNKVPYFKGGLPHEYHILVVPVDKVEQIQHLFDVVSTEGQQGIKRDSYWVVSTSTAFGDNGTNEVLFYNQLMLNAKSRGFGYLQITFKNQ